METWQWVILGAIMVSAIILGIWGLIFEVVLKTERCGICHKLIRSDPDREVIAVDAAGSIVRIMLCRPHFVQYVLAMRTEDNLNDDVDPDA